MPPLSVPGCISSAEEFLSPVLFVLPGSRTVPHAQWSSERSCTDPPQLLTHRPWFSLQLSSLAWIWCPVAFGWSDKRFASVCSPQSTLSSLHFLHSTLSQLFPRVKSPGLPSHYKPGPNLGQDLFSSTKVSAVPLNLLRWGKWSCICTRSRCNWISDLGSNTPTFPALLTFTDLCSVSFFWPLRTSNQGLSMAWQQPGQNLHFTSEASCIHQIFH